MSFDPDIATKAWEIYRDPSDESVDATVDQPGNTNPRSAMAGAASASHRPIIPEPTLEQDHAEIGSSTSTPSTPPNHTITYAPTAASRVVAERMLRTLTMILAEEKKRQRRVAALAAAAGDVNIEIREATTDELVGRLEKRYAELTVLEEREKTGEEGQSREGEQEHGAAEVEAQDQLGVQATEMREAGVKPGERIYGPSIKVPVSMPAAQTPSSISTFISMSGTTPSSRPGSGLSFAERAKARDKKQARKKARLTGPEGEAEACGGGAIVSLDEMIPGTGAGSATATGGGLSKQDLPDRMITSHEILTDSQKRKRHRERRGKKAARIEPLDEHQDGGGVA